MILEPIQDLPLGFHIDPLHDH